MDRKFSAYESAIRSRHDRFSNRSHGLNRECARERIRNAESRRGLRFLSMPNHSTIKASTLRTILTQADIHSVKVGELPRSQSSPPSW